MPRRVFKAFIENKSGATAIEYALIAGFIFVVVIIGIQAYTNQTQVLYNKIGNAISGVGGTS